MRTPFAKMAVLPSLALAMLIAVGPAAHAQEYLSQEAAYFHRHHAAPPLAYDTQAQSELRVRSRSVRWDRMMSSRATALSAAIPTPSFGESFCATTIWAGRIECGDDAASSGMRLLS